MVVMTRMETTIMGLYGENGNGYGNYYFWGYMGV